MITMQENMGVDASRTALTVNNAVEFNTHIDWNVVGPTLVVLLVLGLLALWHKDYVIAIIKDNFVTRWRGKRRMEQKREEKVREIISDNIQDAVDDAFLEGAITAEERRWAFKALGRVGFPDLLSRAMREEIAAEEAKKEAKDKETNSFVTVHVL